MLVQDLAGRWSVTKASGGRALPATVPGCIHTDLMAAGKLPELDWRLNENLHQWPVDEDWTFEREFEADPGLLACDRVLLRCEGLDTLATVTVNGRTVIRADNMYRTWEAEVGRLLTPGRNRIAVTFRSTIPEMAKRTKEFRLPGWNLYDPRFHGKSWIRKMPCSFGWDWGPKAATCGIWRPIRLVGLQAARLTDLRIAQAHRPGAVDLDLTLAAERCQRGALRAECVLSLDGRPVAETETTLDTAGAGAVRLTVRQPRLWWPNGLGDQTLYRLEVVLRDADGRELDRWTRRLGLRELVLDRHADQWGESFQFTCNGVPFFAKGANWVPADYYLPRLHGETRGRYRDLLESARDAHMNFIRLWGGGFYEQDDFYDLCDELGLCIWHDFMFACSTYPSFDRAFMANVEAEVRQHIARVRHHPSIALWCGNNELEQGLATIKGWNEWSMSWADYARLFDVLLPDLVHELDPQRPYWPCSPHTPKGDRGNWNDPASGDAHCWDVWFGNRPFEHQRTWLHRFMSEFGFQSFPEPRTVAAFTEPADRNLTSPVMDFHQRSGMGNRTIFAYLLDWFRFPKDYAESLWLTQLTQALCIQYAAEHGRRQQPRMMGIIYWQLNDLWPCASWSSIDVFGRWKALQHLARRFFEPIHVSLLEDEKAQTMAVHLSNHRRDRADLRWRWWATDTTGRILGEGRGRLRAAPQADRCVATVDCRELVTAAGGVGKLLFWAEVVEGRTEVSRQCGFLARPKQLELAKAKIRTRVTAAKGGGFTVRLESDRPALWARLELAGEDARFGDNFLHLDRKTPVEVTCIPARELTLAQVKKALRVTSLVDTY